MQFYYTNESNCHERRGACYGIIWKIRRRLIPLSAGNGLTVDWVELPETAEIVFTNVQDTKSTLNWLLCAFGKVHTCISKWVSFFVGIECYCLYLFIKVNKRITQSLWIPNKLSSVSLLAQKSKSLDTNNSYSSASIVYINTSTVFICYMGVVWVVLASKTPEYFITLDLKLYLKLLMISLCLDLYFICKPTYKSNDVNK